MKNTTVIQRILDRVRWAPSGDNRQLWRYRVHGERHFTLYGLRDAGDIYDHQHYAGNIEFGALLRTMKIAAAAEGFGADVTLTLRPERREADVKLAEESLPALAALAPAIETRSVNRFPLAMTPLGGEHKRALEAAAGAGYRIVWFETPADRARCARLLFQSGRIRLSFEEFIATHRRVIAWGCATSPDKIPEQALGLDPLLRLVSRWALADWRRMDFLNRFLAGTLMPRLEMDIIPALFCGAHYMIVADEKPATVVQWVAAGEAVQSFWLTAESLDLRGQPETTPLIFSHYARDGVHFTKDPRGLAWAGAVKTRYETLLAGRVALDNVVWMGRIGHGPRRAARSLRKPLDLLEMHD